MLRRLLPIVSPWGPALAGLPRAAAMALGAPGPAVPARPARLWLAMGVVLPITAGTHCALSRVTLVMSPSIRAWVVHEAPGPIARGDLVSFLLVHPLAGPEAVRVTKYALCLPGDAIDWRETPSHEAGRLAEARYFCRGRLLGVTRPVGHDGKPLAHWHPRYTVIPPGMIYLGSAHPGGFDSRYYGPIAIARLTRMEKVL